MADHEHLDTGSSGGAGDPFLERRLSSLAVLPVPERPSVDDLAARAVGDDRGSGRALADGRTSHRGWLVAGAAAAVVLVLLAVGVVRSGQEAEIGSSAVGGLAGREFWSTSVIEGGTPRTAPVDPASGTARSEVALRFDADGASLSAWAGCNTAHARYTIEGDRLVVADMGGTEMACLGPYAGQDAWLSGILGSSPVIALDGARLTLTSGTTIIELVDRSIADRDLSLIGPWWELHTIVEDGASRSAFVGPMSDPPAFTVLALPDGQLVLNGTDGCQGLRVPVVLDGATLRVGEPTAEGSNCVSGPDAGVAFDAVLGGDSIYAIDGSTLTITHDDVALVFQGRPRSEAPTTVPPTTGATVPAPTRSGSIDDLIGSWELSSIVVDGAPTSVAPAADVARPSLTFTVDPADPTLVLDAYDGCNGGGGRAAATSTAISFGAMGWEERACPGIDDGVVATTMHSVLLGETTYSLDRSVLIISNGTSSLILRSSTEPSGG